MDLCEHAETVLRLGKEVTRKEHQVEREQRLKHEFEDENLNLKAEVAELKEKNKEGEENQAKLRVELALVRSLLASKTDEVAITQTSESYQSQRITTRATTGKRASISALGGSTDESLPKRRISDGLTLANDWHSEGVECTISGHPVISYWDKTCVIKAVTGTVCLVRIKASVETIVVGCVNLKPVTPQVNQKVKILNGAGVGETGELISVDDDDAVIRLNSEPHLGMLLKRTLKLLGKISPY